MLELGGHEIRVAVRESARARRGRLVMRAADLVELVVPVGTSERTVRRSVDERLGWIDRQARRLRAHAARPGLGLEREGVVWLGGRPLPVRRLESGAARAELVDGALVVRGPADGRSAAVERWYRREARRTIGAGVAREAARLGISAQGPLSIRDPRTRWASCSAVGALSFSWRLLLAPPEVLDYVVVHELCHRRELNHSARFWRLVAAACPDYRRHAAWLREHGEELHAYVPRP